MCCACVWCVIFYGLKSQSHPDQSCTCNCSMFCECIHSLSPHNVMHSSSQLIIWLLPLWKPQVHYTLYKRIGPRLGCIKPHFNDFLKQRIYTKISLWKLYFVTCSVQWILWHCYSNTIAAITAGCSLVMPCISPFSLNSVMNISDWFIISIWDNIKRGLYPCARVAMFTDICNSCRND